MRPEKHFTPEKGWMNDPNGAVLIGDEYHIFYQYYPDDIVWGPMHWGHAVSKDLIKWEHRNIALFPDANGYCFSGSCVLDVHNISGFGSKEQPALIAIYTSHNPDTSWQQQCIAYSTDYQNFTVYEGNPVIKNDTSMSDYKVDFRDPKVFANEKIGGYSMVVAAGHVIEFYHTDNFIKWEKTGEYNVGAQGVSGIVECPDCMHMITDTGKSKWVLTASMIMDVEETEKWQAALNGQDISNPHVMQYFVGEFDGYTFKPAESTLEVINILGLQGKKSPRRPRILDYGTDNYAMVSFSGADRDNKKLMIGWGEHWDYAAKVPACEYRGKMTLPRYVSLVELNDSYYLKWEMAADSGAEYFDMMPGENITLMNNGAHSLLINVSEEEVLVMRVKNENMSFAEVLNDNNYNVFRAKRLRKGVCKIQIANDNGYYEMIADDGLLPFSVMTY